MSIIVPGYYKKFRCIADKCRHSCCIGWEIDIDDDTLAFYKCIKGDMGKRFNDCISEDGNAHFILSENERCPFLNNDGLCDIILELGEDSLCEICAEHPRFRNFYSSHTELGIGLCCEEAARIILSEKDAFSLVAIEGGESIKLSEEEKNIFSLRNRIFSLICDRSLSFGKRFYKLADEFGILPDDFLCEKLKPAFISLERLDENWTGILENLSYSNLAFLDRSEYQLPLEQLFCYFIYRYFAEAVFDEKTVPRLKFAMAACVLIGALWERHNKHYGIVDLCDMAEYSRMYSSEVEYSEENISIIFDII